METSDDEETNELLGDEHFTDNHRSTIFSNDNRFDSDQFDRHDQQLPGDPGNIWSTKNQAISSSKRTDSIIKTQLIIEFTSLAGDRLIYAFVRRLLISGFRVQKCGLRLHIRVPSRQLMIEAHLISIPIWIPDQIGWRGFRLNDHLLKHPSIAFQQLGRLEQAQLCDHLIRTRVKSVRSSRKERLKLNRSWLDACLEAGLCRPPYCPAEIVRLTALRFACFCWAVALGFCALPLQRLRIYFGSRVALQLRFLDVFVQCFLPLALLGQLFQLLQLPSECFALICILCVAIYAHCWLLLCNGSLCNWAERHGQESDDALNLILNQLVEQQTHEAASEEEAGEEEEEEIRTQSSVDTFIPSPPSSLCTFENQTHVRQWFDERIDQLWLKAYAENNRLLHLDRCTWMLLLITLVLHLACSVTFVHTIAFTLLPSSSSSLVEDYRQSQLDHDSEMHFWKALRFRLFLYFLYCLCACIAGDRLLQTRNHTIVQRLQLSNENPQLQPQLLIMHLVMALFAPTYAMLTMEEPLILQELIRASLLAELFHCLLNELVQPLVALQVWKLCRLTQSMSTNCGSTNCDDNLAAVRLESNRMTCPPLKSIAIRIVRLVGHVLLFSGVWPSVPLYALIIAWLNGLAISWQLGWLYQRPIIVDHDHNESTIRLSLLADCLKVLLFLSWLVNCFLVDTFQHAHALLEWTYGEKQWTLLLSVIIGFPLLWLQWTQPIPMYEQKCKQQILNDLVSIQHRRQQLLQMFQRCEQPQSTSTATRVQDLPC